GMGVSLINSNANGFGSLLVAGSSGIFLHDRGLGFNLVPGHPAEYGPGRRPPHTLSPALVTNPDGSLRQVIGTMGGDSQPQILLQLLARTLGLGQSPGAAIRAPRWVLGPDDREAGFATWVPGQGRRVLIEDATTGWHESLAARGHTTALRDDAPHTYGHAHLIEVTDQGTLAGAADPRAAIGVAAGL
ncbi:MAG: gamma-glutamyltranspeptidase, partial [Acidimicrobiaceae bacterium]|nr:gamma-glutamyltranspeptidase [Acidimicrobiaceae bacterium]MYH92738.1 gamma-glutamyltranspeptidase [Acidimicrobiaceae bacterium]